MNQKELSFRPTILIPYDATGNLEDVRISIERGVVQVRDMLREKHPDIDMDEWVDIMKDIMFTNWAITAIAAKEWERRTKALEEKLKVQEDTAHKGYEQASEIIQDLHKRMQSLQEDHQQIQELKNHE